jgi:Protein of unknown function (DUF3106)/EF hand
MSRHPSLLCGLALLLIAAGATLYPFSSPGKEKGSKKPGKEEKKLPDEDRELLKAAKKAFEPSEKRQDKILKEIRRGLENPSEKQQEKVLKEIRKAYQMTPEQEETIRALLQAGGEGSPERQVEAVLAEVRKAEQLPPGVLPLEKTSRKGSDLFRRQDRDGDGRLSREEVSEGLAAEFTRWDVNRDGSIDLDEYLGYLNARAGQLLTEFKPDQRRPSPKQTRAAVPEPTPDVRHKPVVYRAGQIPAGLPAWFAETDTDQDLQVALYEWKDRGWSVDEFRRRDLNEDGFLTIEELQRFLSQTNDASAPSLAPSFQGRSSLIPRSSGLEGAGGEPGKKEKGPKSKKSKKKSKGDRKGRKDPVERE